MKKVVIKRKGWGVTDLHCLKLFAPFRGEGN